MKNEENLLNLLSDNLKNKVLVEANKIVLIDSPIFSKNFSSNVISASVSIIE